MSLFGTLNTGVSGMAAQANLLSTIGDNISNSSTTGYKRATTDFETVLGNQSASSYTAGSVSTQIRYGVSTQGQLTSSTSVTDLAIQGNGFFVVQGTNGATALTRAGSFVPNSAGQLVNTAGYSLMGYNLIDGSSATVNGTGGLQVINLSKQSLTANPTTGGTMVFNLNSGTTAAATGEVLPAANDPTATTGATTSSAASTFKTSVAAYDDLGNAVTFDIYLTKTGTDTSGNSVWQAAVYNQADAATGGGFPYTVTAANKTNEPNGPLLSLQNLTYSSTTGKLTSATVGGTKTASTTAGPLALTIPIPGGQTMNLDISGSTQLASASNVTTATVNGSAPSKLDHVTIGTDGTVTSVYTNGIQQATYRIPLADVPSEDNLTPVSGNVYEPNLASGTMTIGTATSGSLGSIKSNELENSTVDLATELTNMISAQRSYEANSKVIQASSDLLKVVDQLSG
ncbi:flagellar hook protein FlgE [Lichenibacterium ramalinae]|uniref:Flagellar hook protein FlgE n=1 Tax=Lichenibacterium ramalinae TaxID=2316527 RepID=A0A4Q2REH5_9HYPH|nr:flagellar hook protein FlgE [Lichenibacterium ramalinae]RYB05960.1 flagellar hook protein FlgE [Lichenibacterium ramalinae]